MMMGEATLCLALGCDRLPYRAGLLTPAAVMGGVIVEQLRAAEITLDIERV